MDSYSGGRYSLYVLSVLKSNYIGLIFIYSIKSIFTVDQF